MHYEYSAILKVGLLRGVYVYCICIIEVWWWLRNIN